MSHRCPITACVKLVPDDRLMCSRHWSAVPAPLQKTIYLLWNSGKPKPGHAEACTSAIAQVNQAARR